MTRYSLIAVAAVGAVLSTSAAASAQYQYPGQPYPTAPSAQQQYFPPGSVMPNIYNPATQPLSPYLNLLRGGNPGVNYYYGVRPGTPGGFGQVIGVPHTAPGGNRQLFFPQLASAPDPLQPREAGVGDVLPPAGHPVVFNNTMGYFPGVGARGGSVRPGLSGIGTSRAPRR